MDVLSQYNLKLQSKISLGISICEIFVNYVCFINNSYCPKIICFCCYKIIGKNSVLSGPVAVKNKDASRPSPSKSPRRGRHLSESQRGGDYSPSPCREGRRGRKGQSPGPPEGHLKAGRSGEEDSVEVGKLMNF